LAPAGAAITLRPAAAGDVASIAPIWRSGWADAHAGHVPGELTAARTEQSFWARAADLVPCSAVAEVGGRLAGFVTVVGDELEQVYVDRACRGSGVAAALLAEGERRVREGGHEVAWLAVVAGNRRARRFYAKHGWTDEGPFDHRAPGPRGPITVPAHRYVKAVGDAESLRGS
jgi:GNAT superfamily N-acetyltransferase